MNNDLIRRLQALAREHGLAFANEGEGWTLTIVRDGVRVTVTVPVEVLEWFASAEADTGDNPALKSRRRVQDWGDYAGYDNTPPAQLAREMAVDVQTFVARLLARPLQLVTLKRGRAVLQWRIDEQWRQALPLTGGQ